jgi:uncharacterized protein YjiS (DUF1127 family)
MNTPADKAFLTGFAGRSRGATFGGAPGILSRLLTAWRVQRARTKAIDELLRLDDRLLADMGVRRWELRERVEGGRQFGPLDA